MGYGDLREQERVCVIGGGPTGISVGAELNVVGIHYDLYETESDFGGVWNGEGACGRAYPSLHLISPKFNTQFSDYPMPEDYPHYPNHNLMLRYIRSYAKQFGVYEKTRFNTTVTKLTPEKERWEVELSNGDRRSYDFVCVCNGLQRLPYYPDPPYPGEFLGEVMHAMEYKTPDQLKNKRIVCIGAGNSGCDIVVDAVHHGAEVYHSTRRGYYYQPKFIDGKPTPQWMMELGNMFGSKKETLAYIKQVFKLAGYDGADYGLKKPDYPLDAAHAIMNSQILYHIGHGDVQPKGDVTSFQDQTVLFEDGSKVEADMVVYATGYQRQFPFLDPKYLTCEEKIPDLFLHIAPKNFNHLFFLGYINTAAGLGDAAKAQAQFLVSYLKGMFGQTKGYTMFLKAKNEDTADLGQGVLHRLSAACVGSRPVEVFSLTNAISRYARGALNQARCREGEGYEKSGK